MNILLTAFGTLLLWVGVIVVGETWAKPRLFAHWQFYVTILLFVIAIEIFKEVGRRE